MSEITYTLQGLAPSLVERAWGEAFQGVGGCLDTRLWAGSPNDCEKKRNNSNKINQLITIQF